MTSDQLLASWGRGRVNRTYLADGVHEQWVYYNANYIYVDNGIVTAIQQDTR